MKFPLHLEFRLTCNYVPGWTHLDRRIAVCSAKTTEPYQTHRDWKHGESADYKSVVTISPQQLEVAQSYYRYALNWLAAEGRFPLPSFRQFMESAIEDAHLQGCQCEFDCCGHWQQYAVVNQTGRREFVARIHRYRNV